MNKLIPQIEELLGQKGRCLVAIDGPCAAGKTTLAAALAQQLGADVFHTDDFFLQPHQRTPERFAQPGGNIDYERLEQELLAPLKKGEPFCYRPFDCRKMQLGAPRPVAPRPLCIVEGSYSLHPRCAGYYDLKLLLTVDRQTQQTRLQARSPALYDRFLQEWIPLENRYFDQTAITRRCDRVIETGEWNEYFTKHL